MKGIDLISQERQRQIEQEGLTLEHDQQHENGELAIAAACYATKWTEVEDLIEWPWAKEYDKREKHGIVRRLSIAGALIAAELDRILAKMQEELICPMCGSDEVYYENPRTGSGAYTCQCCGYILKDHEVGERL